MNEQQLRELNTLLLKIKCTSKSSVTKQIAGTLHLVLTFFANNMFEGSESKSRATKATLSIIAESHLSANFFNSSGNEIKNEHFSSYYNLPAQKADYQKSFAELKRKLKEYSDFISFDSKNFTITIG